MAMYISCILGHYLDQIAEAFPDKTIFLTGHVVLENEANIPSNVVVFKEIAELPEFLASTPNSWSLLDILLPPIPLNRN